MSYVRTACLGLLPAFTISAIPHLASADPPAASLQKLEQLVKAVPESLAAERDRALRAVVKYRRSETALFDKAFSELDRLRRRVESNRDISDEVKAAYLAEIDATRQSLQTGAALPNCDVTLDYVTAASKKFDKARSILGRAVTNVARKLRTENLSRPAGEIEQAFAKLGGSLDAGNTLVAGTVFKGRRIPDGGDDGITLRMTLGSRDGDITIGRVERGWQYTGHPIHEMQWEIDGLTFRAVTGKSIAPGNKIDQPFRYEGMIVGKVIAGTFTKIDKKGKAVNGRFRVVAK